MILEKIRVAVETSTMVKFIASLPVTLTIRETLPILAKKYRAVVEENFSQEEHQKLFEARHITRIIKNDYLLPLDEEVLHILADNDQIYLQLTPYDKQAEVPKKERLEAKKAEKKVAEKGKEKSAEYIKAVQKIRNGEEPKIAEQKKQSVKKSEEKSVGHEPNISELLSRFKGEIESGSFKKEAVHKQKESTHKQKQVVQKQKQLPKKKAVVIQQQDSQ